MTERVREPEIRLEMLSKPRLLAAARAMVGNVAQRLGFNEVECGQVSLAVDESLCNIINHGYDRQPDGRIWLSVYALDHEPGGIEIVIEDRARQVDPCTIQPTAIPVSNARRTIVRAGSSNVRSNRGTISGSKKCFSRTAVFSGNSTPLAGFSPEWKSHFLAVLKILDMMLRK